MPKAHFTVSCVKETKRRQILVAEGWNGGKLAGQLRMELWFPKGSRITDSKKDPERLGAAKPLAESVLWRKFSTEEIKDFSKRTGDTNPIHLQEHPVVQGVLLWQVLFAHLAEPAALLMTFHRPVHGGEKIYLREEVRNEQNEREFALCGCPCGTQLSGAGTDAQWRLCRAIDRVGVPFFSAAFYPGQGDGADHHG